MFSCASVKCIGFEVTISLMIYFIFGMLSVFSLTFRNVDHAVVKYILWVAIYTSRNASKGREGGLRFIRAS